MTLHNLKNTAFLSKVVLFEPFAKQEARV